MNDSERGGKRRRAAGLLESAEKQRGETRRQREEKGHDASCPMRNRKGETRESGDARRVTAATHCNVIALTRIRIATRAWKPSEGDSAEARERTGRRCDQRRRMQQCCIDQWQGGGCVCAPLQTCTGHASSASLIPSVHVSRTHPALLAPSLLPLCLTALRPSHFIPSTSLLAHSLISHIRICPIDSRRFTPSP